MGEGLRGRNCRIERIATSRVDAALYAEMAALYGHAIERSRESFARGLAATDQVYLARDEHGRLCGMACLTELHHRIDGRDHCLLFTSMAAIEPGSRGGAIIMRMGIDSYLRARLRRPRSAIYWAFAALTLPAYLILVRNYRTCWPQVGSPTPPTIVSLLDALGARLGHYDPVRRCITIAGMQVRPGPAAEARPEAAGDEHVRFFHEQNPNSRDGVCLLCLCPLTARNWAHALTHQLTRQLRRLSLAAPKPSDELVS